MSLKIATLKAASVKKNLTRTELLGLVPDVVYDDGRTKQSFKDETDINKIMARFDKTGTISHLAKYEGVYADFSDFDFHKQSNMLAQGGEIFAALPAELRQEFGQSPARFFNYVNDPRNIDELRRKLPALAEPGQQLPRSATPDADKEAAIAAASEPVASELIKTAVVPAAEKKETLVDKSEP